jgi:hypothetical protein
MALTIRYKRAGSSFSDPVRSTSGLAGHYLSALSAPRADKWINELSRQSDAEQPGEERMAGRQVIGGVALVLVLNLSARAQQEYDAVIQTPDVQVRSGPSLEYYATSRLYRGEKVKVRGNQNGWLAIAPPRPGEDSFSWIQASQVRQDGLTATVTAPSAPVRIGSLLFDAPPTTEQVKLAQGTQVVLIGKGKRAADGLWLPIVPPANEVRYIPMDAIREAAPVQQTQAPPTAPASSSFALPTPGPAPGRGESSGFSQTPSAPSQVRNDSLVLRAQQADFDGNTNEAIRLYEQVARETTDQELRIRCLNHSQFLRDALAARRPQSQPAPTVDPASAWSKQDNRLGPMPAAGSMASAYPPAQRQAASEYCYVPEPCRTVRLRPPVYGSTAPAAAPAPTSNWYGPGWVTRTTFQVEGKPVYRMESDTGQLWAYVTAGPDVDLERYVGRKAHLHGTLQYRGDLRTHYMSVVQASPAR